VIRKTDIEITAPVGSFESLAAAFQAGAGSVYFGVGHLNMRSRSSVNFSLEDLGKIVKACHRKKCRAYLTLNTVVFDRELNEIRLIVDQAVKSGVDAVIASDISVIRHAREKGMEVHLSTQANITNIEAVRFYAAYADVMVTARELSLEQVAEITRQIREENICGPSGQPVKIEIFAHGALCMAVSGKCYLSLDLYNHSANRGECYQTCRLAYRVFDEEGEVELLVDNPFIMSPKDLKTIDFLDKIVDAGVSVLKIEGRGRSPEYVKTVTTCYREAVEAIQAGIYTQGKIRAWNERLKTVYNRGFWDGYYLGQKLGEWSDRYGSHATETKIYVGLVMNYFSGLKVAEIRIDTGEIKVGDPMLITGKTTGVVEEKVQEIRVDLKNVSMAAKGDLCSIPVSKRVRPGDKLYKKQKTND